MVLTKKKSFSVNNTNNNRSRKINRVSQEGSGKKPKHVPTPEQKAFNRRCKKKSKV